VSAFSLLLLGLLTVFQLGSWQGVGRTSLRTSIPQSDDEEPARSPLLSKTRATPTGDKYLIGVGKADITGPVVEINFAGYASTGQNGNGLRQRLYSRAFIVGDVNNPSDRFVYLILDTQSGDSAVRMGILDGLKALGSSYSVYGQANVAVTGTHSHSGPGAWFNYLLPQITSLGFNKQSYQAIVDGAVLSIKRAHESLTTVCQTPLPNRKLARFYADAAPSRVIWTLEAQTLQMQTSTAVSGLI
jgi:neutral ceramidase